MKNDYTIIIESLPADDGGGYLGRVPELRGCMSDGATRQEAITNTEQAILEWIEEAVSLGRTIPQPARLNLAA